MKKVIILLLCTLLFINCAYADINFQSVDWLANDSEVMKVLSEKGILRENAGTVSFSQDNVLYIITNDVIDYQPFRIPAYSKYAYSASLKSMVKGKIASYPIDNVTLTFAYDGEFKLIAIKVDFINADYLSLREKMIKAYGEGETKTIEDEGIESIVWKGENNSGVMLYTESFGDDYTLMYGRLDAEEILQKCLEVELDDTTGL